MSPRGLRRLHETLGMEGTNRGETERLILADETRLDIVGRPDRKRERRA